MKNYNTTINSIPCLPFLFQSRKDQSAKRQQSRSEKVKFIDILMPVRELEKPVELDFQEEIYTKKHAWFACIGYLTI